MTNLPMYIWYRYIYLSLYGVSIMQYLQCLYSFYAKEDKVEVLLWLITFCNCWQYQSSFKETHVLHKGNTSKSIFSQRRIFTWVYGQQRLGEMLNSTRALAGQVSINSSVQSRQSVHPAQSVPLKKNTNRSRWIARNF